MKHIALLLTLLALAFGSSARAAVSTTNFVALRAEVVNQLTIASNTLPVNKKLIASLKKSLAVIDKPGVANLVNDTKVLTLVLPLNKTPLSNTFSPLLNVTLDNYVSIFTNAAALSASALASTVPSGVHNTALAKLNVLLTQLGNANSLSDLIAAAKQLAAAAKTLGVVNALVVKAQHAPLPKGQLQATINALFGSFNYTPIPASALGAFYTPVFNQLQIVAGNGTHSGSGFGTTSTARVLEITIPDLQDGTTTYQIGNDSGEVYVLHSILRGNIHGVVGQDVYLSGNAGSSGSLTVTVNKAAHTAFGTFSFSIPGATTTASTSNGSFSVTWTE